MEFGKCEKIVILLRQVFVDQGLLHILTSTREGILNIQTDIRDKWNN